MTSSLEEIVAQLPDVHEKSQFNRQDAFVILQGYTGFFSGLLGEDPFAALGAAVEVAGNFATRCNTGSLHENLSKAKRWLTFGKEYAALEDSSDLDFDKLDIGSVPEVMKVISHTWVNALVATCIVLRNKFVHKFGSYNKYFEIN